MGSITIEGGHRLGGDVTVQGAKNSVLPILAATLLCGGECRIRRCPHLSDVDAAADILRYLGCKVDWSDGDLLVDSRVLARCDIPQTLMRRMRSSVIFLGAILARCGWAELSYPGGCELGPRPIDLHLAALRTLGASIEERGGKLYCQARHLTGGQIVLAIPSVGATENAMLAACGAEGVTVITNAAREPEIVDLQDFLCACGAEVRGAGGSVITVEGKRPLHGCSHRVIADRIVAATYLCAGAAAGGDILLRQADCRHLATVTTALQQAGCRIDCGEEGIRLRSEGRLQAVTPVRTAPYPGFPTDCQAILMAALLRSRGTTVFVENIFESRYRHVAELQRMGADIRVEGRVAVVCGVERLHGADVLSADLRGGAALALAALAARGSSRLGGVEFVRRGYADLDRLLAGLGAQIWQEIPARSGVVKKTPTKKQFCLAIGAKK